MIGLGAPILFRYRGGGFGKGLPAGSDMTSFITHSIQGHGPMSYFASKSDSKGLEALSLSPSSSKDHKSSANFASVLGIVFWIL